MSCSLDKDCLPMKCNKNGSSLVCIKGGCACTIPKTKKNNFILILVLMVVIVWLLRLKHDSPYFIPSVKFIGYKKGYVFKTDNGKTGYYKDTF